MRKIKIDPCEQKYPVEKQLAPYYYREKALGHSTEKPGRLILKINFLPADKKATFSTEEIRLNANHYKQAEERASRKRAVHRCGRR